MANLTIDNLNRMVQSGDVEKFFTSQTGSSQKMNSTELARSSDGGEASLPEDNAASFSDILKDSINKVNQYQVQANTAIKEMIAGRNKNIHETMLTIERADTSLKLMMQVRNKILDAYKEIIRMQV